MTSDMTTRPSWTVCVPKDSMLPNSARSNYNFTALTLTSMLEMSQIGSIDALTAAGPSERNQYLVVADLINSATGIDALRQQGYEIVAAPSEFEHLALQRADRSEQGGQLTAFELDLLVSSSMRLVAPEQLGAWASEQHRDHIAFSLDATAALSGERVDHPRFVLTHVLSPHPPPVFGPGGSPRAAMSCFPYTCPFWLGLERYPDDVIEPAETEQLDALNPMVLSMSRTILESSARPPVVIVMSDHGHRLHPADHDEMLRSLFASYTPGFPNLFPDDATPINIIPRLLNAYAGTSIALQEEDSFWVDRDLLGSRGFLDLNAIDPDGSRGPVSQN